MSKMKRALSLLLVMLITVTAFALPTSAASTNAPTTKEPNSITGTPENSPDQPEYPTPGAIGLSKTAAPVQEGGDNDYYYEITLTIDGKNIHKPADVVLVLDASQTMAENLGFTIMPGQTKSKWQQTIDAALEFGKKLLPGGGTTDAGNRIAVVFSNSAEVGALNHQQFFDNYAAYEEALRSFFEPLSQTQPGAPDDWLKVNYMPNNETNLQAGIYFGQKIIDENPANTSTKHMVIMSDGEPNANFPLANSYNTSETDASRWSSFSGSFDPVISGAAVPKDSPLLDLKYLYQFEDAENPNGEVKNLDLYAPELAKDAGGNGAVSFNLYLPNVTGSGSSVAGFPGCFEDGFISVNDAGDFQFQGTDGNGEGARSGSAAAVWEARVARGKGTIVYSVTTQPKNNTARNVMKACTTNPAEGKGYFELGANESDYQGKLEQIFTQIAGRLAIAATNGLVVDPMSDEVELVPPPTASGTLNHSSELSYNGQTEVYLSQGSAIWDAANNAIKWDVDDVREGETATMKYRVKVKNPSAHIPASGGNGEPFFTNKKTWFDYTNYEGVENTIKHFDVPTVALPGGTIKLHYYLVDENGNPISESGEQVAFPLVADVLKPAHLWADENGNTGLLPAGYNVSVEQLDGYQYYGYTLDGKLAGAVGKNTNPTVTATVGKGTSTEIWLAYQKAPEVFYVAHVRKASYQTSNIGYVNYTDTYDVVEHFNIVETTNASYLYGGTFEQGESTTLPESAAPVNASVKTDKLHVYDQVEDFHGGTPFDFNPKAGETYYIWEVSQKYLWNYGYRVATPVKDGEGKYVSSFSPIVNVDRPDYRQIGITVDGVDRSCEYEGAPATFGDLLGYQKVNDEYKRVYLNRATLAMVTQTGKAPERPNGSDIGFLGYITIGKDEGFYQAGSQIVCQPYWVTKDGVKVTGIETGTYTYREPGVNGGEVDVATSRVGTTTTTWVQPMARKMVFRRSMRIVDAENQVEEPTPAPTEEPAPTETPEPTPEPIVDTRITVTVNDNDGTYQVADEPGDWTGKINYQNVSGKVFAGWFADEAFTVPVNFSNIQENTTIYAKYVSSAFLKLNYTEQRLFRSQLTLFSAIDTKNYAETGFVINGKAVPTKNYTARYNLLFTPLGLFGNEVGNDASLMVSTYQTSGMKRGDKLTITPYWVTLDGTTVYGAERTLTNGWLGLAG